MGASPILRSGLQVADCASDFDEALSPSSSTIIFRVAVVPARSVTIAETLSAALGHLLVVLRARGAIAPPVEDDAGG